MDCKFRKSERPGLYIMVFLTMLASCAPDSSRTQRPQYIEDELVAVVRELRAIREELALLNESMSETR
jgi:hypothetical protein